MAMMTIPENIDIPESSTSYCDRFICVPLCMQETEYTCGVACVQSILGYYGIGYRQDVLAQILQTKPVVGTDFRNILLLMRQLGFEAYFVENMSIENLIFLINNGITPLLMLQAWAADGVDYASDWNDAHYVIACGYSGNRIVCMDPYTFGNYTYIPASALLKRWHVKDVFGRCYYGGGLIITKKYCPFIYDPRVVKYLG